MAQMHVHVFTSGLTWNNHNLELAIKLTLSYPKVKDI